ncbi:BlaI/MecI/CopY family transcriptional regulator [Solicola gregarius]|uniref:BlaI/MecI/CopY family transcriptional regulator n=2 Tax=Solicola gregarius TaxID=2908642 RepID=A0AA46TMQ2_9ACTN|nr:BlaI/MecI/CopY family transcriptional regulator [Solicola gregarius]
MDRLWAAGERLTVRDVHDQLSAERPLAYTTVMTVLDRLTRKDMVVRTQRGRAYLYAPANSRDELTAELLNEVLDGAGGDRTAALVHFAETVSADEADALRTALARIEAQHEDTT